MQHSSRPKLCLLSVLPQKFSLLRVNEGQLQGPLQKRQSGAKPPWVQIHGWCLLSFTAGIRKVPCLFPPPLKCLYVYVYFMYICVYVYLFACMHLCAMCPAEAREVSQSPLNFSYR